MTSDQRGGAARPRPGEVGAGTKGRLLAPHGANPLPSLGRIKREKGVWWMPWQQEAMKDVVLCDKPWGAENGL